MTMQEINQMIDAVVRKCKLADNQRYLVENAWDCMRYGDGTRDVYHCGAAECGSQELSDKIFRELFKYF